MKQIIKKKPKVFRILIRSIRIDGKTTKNDSNGQNAERKNESGKGDFSSFSVGKTLLHSKN